MNNAFFHWLYKSHIATWLGFLGMQIFCSFVKLYTACSAKHICICCMYVFGLFVDIISSDWYRFAKNIVSSLKVGTVSRSRASSHLRCFSTFSLFTIACTSIAAWTDNRNAQHIERLYNIDGALEPVKQTAVINHFLDHMCPQWPVWLPQILHIFFVTPVSVLHCRLSSSFALSTIAFACATSLDKYCCSNVFCHKSVRFWSQFWNVYQEEQLVDWWTLGDHKLIWKEPLNY